MKFSVVIPTFNRRALLQEALESVHRQRFRDFEIIVGDDGSTDGTSEWLSAVHPEIIVSHLPNMGPGWARTAAARRASGEYLAFLDSDDTWLPWTLETFADVIAATNASLLSGAPLSEDKQAVRGSLVYKEYPDFIATAGSEHVGAGFLVIRRDLFESLDGFWPLRWNAEDHDLCLRAGTAPVFARVLSPATSIHRNSPDSLTGNLASSFGGLLAMLMREEEGKYPGGDERADERRAILTMHIRPLAIATRSFHLYRKTFRWHVRQRRWRFLALFPLSFIR